MARFVSLVLLPLSLMCTLAAGQEGGDLQAQILYAYHAENSGRLRSLIQTLSAQVAAGGADNALAYHLAHAEYRLGALSAAQDPHGADAAFSQCIDRLKRLLGRDPASVESLILQSDCYSGLAAVSRFGAVLLRARASDRVQSALKLAPENPRGVLTAALQELARSDPGSPDNARAFSRLRFAAQLFERSSATSIEAPGWGHADAYLELGRQLQARGDIVGARNWIEKALIASPDFKAAQRQMADLMHR